MATYYVDMPTDYLHLLNCICIYTVNKTYKCYNKGDSWRAPATRLTADMYSQVLDNFWNKPTYKKPYYYIHNVNRNIEVPTNPINSIQSISNSQEENNSQNSPGLDLGLVDPGISIEPSTGPVSGEISGGVTPVSTISIDPKQKNVSYEALNNITLFKITNTSYIAGQSGTIKWKIIGCPDWITLDKTSGQGSSTITAKTITKNSGESSRTATLSIKNEDETIEFATFTLSQLSSQQNDSSVFFTSNSSNGTDAIPDGNSYGKDGNRASIVQGDKINRTINIGGNPVSNVERGQGLRYGNVSKVRLEIRYGTDDSVFTLEKVYIDYIKTPQHIRLTQYEVDRTEDISQMLEFPDYVCQEILNELVHLVMENISDQRLQTHPVVSQSIANPAQAQAPQAAQGQAAQ